MVNWISNHRMAHDYYLRLAETGVRFPIGTDLVLNEKDDPEAIRNDGKRLGAVMAEAAERYGAPVALPLMDLTLEKADVLRAFGIPEDQADAYHFEEPPDEQRIAAYAEALDAPFSRRNQAHIDSIRYIRESTKLVPAGMAIGPFSLMTKLMADPITAVAMAGKGLNEDATVLLAVRCLALAEAAVRRSLRAQMAAGASAVLVCEPAANVVYLSPRQVNANPALLEQFVLGPDTRMKQQLDAAGVDLIFHDCGELSTAMVEQFAKRLDPVILSLGSSRRLWEDAAVVPKHIVLYGNLPTKNFYSDAVVSEEDVARLSGDLAARMREVGHPFILGSECDVLHVPDAAATIRRKVDVMLASGRE